MAMLSIDLSASEAIHVEEAEAGFREGRITRKELLRLEISRDMSWQATREL